MHQFQERPHLLLIHFLRHQHPSTLHAHFLLYLPLVQFLHIFFFICISYNSCTFSCSCRTLSALHISCSKVCSARLGPLPPAPTTASLPLTLLRLLCRLPHLLFLHPPPRLLLLSSRLLQAFVLHRTILVGKHKGLVGEPF